MTPVWLSRIKNRNGWSAWKVAGGADWLHARPPLAAAAAMVPTSLTSTTDCWRKARLTHELICPGSARKGRRVPRRRDRKHLAPAGVKGRAGAREDACPPGSRGSAMAQWPPRAGGRSNPSRHDGREGHGQVFPPVNELVDADVHLLADPRRAEPGRVQVGDVGGTLHGSRAHTEDPEVRAGLTTQKRVARRCWRSVSGAPLQTYAWSSTVHSG